MIQDYVKRLIDAYFQACEERIPSRGSWKSLIKWKADFQLFAEDTFRKWLASRSGATVNHLLDAGMDAADEQRLVKMLECDLETFFHLRWNQYCKNLVFPLWIIATGAILWAIVLAVCVVKSPDWIWRISCLCCLTSGVCIGLAGILFYLDPKNRLGMSRWFISHYFVEAESQWEKRQDQEIKLKRSNDNE